MRKREIKIYCPKCRWEPEPSSRWQCVCPCIWNTFDTGGVCPDCGKAWEETCCLACHRFSPPRNWYHEFVTDTTAVERASDVPLPASGRSFDRDRAND